MVQLFLQTNPKYHLTNKKLQYLLCIAQILSVASGKPLFQEKIRNLKNDFSLEPIADTFMCNRAIQEGSAHNQPLDLGYEDFVLPYTAKRLYATNEPLAEEDKRTLISVFIRFGGYDEKVLCKELNKLSGLRKLPVLSYITTKHITDFLAAAYANPRGYQASIIIAFCEDSVYRTVEAKTEDEPEAPVAVAPQDSPVEEKAAIVPPAPAVTPAKVSVSQRNVLKKCTAYHLTRLVANKRYSLYIETPSPATFPVVTVVSLADNSAVAGTLKRVSDTVYCYSFIGIPSNLKISIDI